MQKIKQDELEVQHDEKHGKFFIPFPDKQAVLRYTHDDEEDVAHITFESIFVPPGLREQGLEEKIVKEAFSFAETNGFSTDPETLEDFLTQHADYI